MAGRLAVDFGTSNTRLALWDDGRKQAALLRVPDILELEQCPDGNGGIAEVPCIPSVIHFGENQVWVGRQVRDQGLLEANATFRTMKRYICNRLPLPRRVNGQTITFMEAGSQFLARVLDYAAAEVDLDGEEIAFTVPVDSYEHYQEWLTGACDTAGLRRYRLLDEASAAALGYGVGIQAGDVYMVFDFGGGTLDVSIVRVEGDPTGGKRCRGLGKGSMDIGGTVIDEWIYQDVLKHSAKSPEDVLHFSGLLLVEAERIKRELTERDSATFMAMDPDTGAALAKDYTRTAFEDLLEQQGLYAGLQSALDQAMAKAREAGYDRDTVSAVLLVGGSSLIPSVRRAVRQIFGERVRYHRPLDAVAVGAAAFVGGVDFYDHIQHDYALRFYNREAHDHAYKTIVTAGTAYPTDGSIARLTIKASHDGQEFLGIDIYEVGNQEACRRAQGGMLDLVFDTSGGARLQQRDGVDLDAMTHFWVNEGSPTFIHAQPPAKRGDARFPVQFTIDGSKRLCVTVRDNQTGKTLLKDHPVIKLT